MANLCTYGVIFSPLTSDYGLNFGCDPTQIDLNYINLGHHLCWCGQYWGIIHLSDRGLTVFQIIMMVVVLRM